MAFSLICFKIDGQEEKKLTFTELYLHLELYLILTEASLIGQNLEPWRGSIRKPMIAWRSIYMHLCLCVGEFAVFLPKKVCINFIFFLVDQRSKITKIQKFSTLISILFNSTCQQFFRIINYA